MISYRGDSARVKHNKSAYGVILTLIFRGKPHALKDVLELFDRKKSVYEPDVSSAETAISRRRPPT